MLVCIVKNARTWKVARTQVISKIRFECQSTQIEVVYFQTKITPLVQNKTTLIQVALKSLYFNVLYYSEIRLVHYRMNLQQGG